MNRKIYILIHIVGWLAFFCSPMMFIDHSSNIDMLRYLFFSMMPFVLMVVFYINYFWLVPRYYIRGNHPHYYIINIISFVVFLIFLHLWMDWGHQIFNDPPPHKHAVDFVENHKAWFFSIRDIFNMTFAAAMATMLRLSENWHKSEVARQEADSISISNNTVRCLIKNSNYPKLENDKSGHGIGLKQVDRRLELAYSGRYKWVKGVSEDKTTYTSEIVISSK